MAIISDKCTGCFACINVCPKDAIAMNYDNKGFYTAIIDYGKCIDCKLCEKICPQLNEIEESNYKEAKTYALIAEDSIREKCSSGGAFYLIGRHIIQSGGAVYGAKFDDDLVLRHYKAKNEKELLGLCKSKYVQSYVGDNIASDIVNELEKGKQVAFVGVPCQIAGIQRIINGYDNFLTVDLLCSGSQPPKFLKKYVDELEKYYGRKIRKIDFRDKRMGWGAGNITLEFRGDGEKILKNEVWFQAFLAHLFINDACKECKYSTFPRMGDISIGDFWNIEKLKPELNDHKGTSLLCINSAKAEKLMEEIREKAKVFEYIDFNFTKHSNWFTNGRTVHPKQDEFYERLESMSFKDSVRETLGYRYDCGVVGCYTSGNYGAALTYYALYRVLKNLSLRVLMIEKTKEEPFPPLDDPCSFKEIPYEKEDMAPLFPNINEMRDLNDLCKSFIVGADQLWNWELFGHSWKVWTLGFADTGKNIISYATSFGEKKPSFPKNVIKEFGSNLKRFSRVSVRELSGVSICNDLFSIKAEQVLDPVFLCDKKVYIDLINKAELKFNKPYIFCYVIWPSDSKISVIRHVKSILNIEPIIVPDALGMERWDKWKDEFNIMSDIKIEEWLSLLFKSNYVISDSFHAYSMSLIFNKQIISIAYKEKGERMKSIQKELGLPSIIDSGLPLPDLDNILEEKYIDFKKAIEKLSIKKTESMKWLCDSLKV